MFSFPFLYSFRPSFVKSFECFPVSKIGNKWGDIELSGKIILPRSAIYSLGLQSFPLALTFKVTNNANNRSTHVGILEFTAKERTCYLPDWLFRHLELKDASSVIVQHVSLPIGTFIKFQPIGLEFLSIKNPKVLLENELQRYVCLTKGDVITLTYKNNTYELRIIETEPADGIIVSIGNLSIEFEKPECAVDQSFVRGKRLNMVAACVNLGPKERKTSTNDNKQEEAGDSKMARGSRGMPYLFYNFGELCYNRNAVPLTDLVFPISLSQSSVPHQNHSNKHEEID